jgi:predicted AlkP superfamily pyrophosphatase or phosphodiesterase
MEMFMKLVLLVASFFSPLLVFAQADTSQKIIWDRKNSIEQQGKPYVIMISIDGFRHDYAEKHGTRFFQKFWKEGVKTKYMLPSYPSLTFPNHYTLVTGLYPSHHGLVSNTIYDRTAKEMYSMRRLEAVTNKKWYGGTPLWVLAEQQQMLSASFYWVGSEAPIQGIWPTYHYRFNEEIPIDKRIQVVKTWLSLPAERRPHFISFYFPEVDHDGHDYGPDGEETGKSVRWVDSVIFKMNEAVKSTGLDVNFIVVSDHGMTKINQEESIVLPVFDSTRVDVARGETLVHVYVKNKNDISSVYRSLKEKEKNYSVILKTDMPEHLHFDSSNDSFNRIGDILLISNWPYVFRSGNRKPDPGAHGFDPYLVTDMRTIFYAWGPAFKKGKTIKPIRNVDVYNVVTRILGLDTKEKNDGNPKVLKRLLKR